MDGIREPGAAARSRGEDDRRAHSSSGRPPAAGGARHSAGLPTAAAMGQTGWRGQAVREAQQDLLQQAVDRIKNHPTVWGRNVVTLSAPAVWPELARHNLDKKTAQVLVYSFVIDQLTADGYEVAADYQSQQTTFFIAWESDVSTDEYAAMMAVVERVRLRPGDDFVRRGRLPAPHSASAALAGRAPPPPTLHMSQRELVMDPRRGVVPRAPPADAPDAARGSAGSRGDARTLEAATDLLVQQLSLGASLALPAAPRPAESGAARGTAGR